MQRHAHIPVMGDLRFRYASCDGRIQILQPQGSVRHVLRTIREIPPPSLASSWRNEVQGLLNFRHVVSSQKEVRSWDRGYKCPACFRSAMASRHRKRQTCSETRERIRFQLPAGK